MKLDEILALHPKGADAPTLRQAQEPERQSRPSGPTISYGGGPMRAIGSPGAMGDAAMAHRAEMEKIHAAEELRRQARNAAITPQQLAAGPRPRVLNHGSLDPLGPLAGITPEEGGRA